MKTRKKLNQVRDLRKRRARAKIKSAARPRLSVFRSNRQIYAQIVDDLAGRTLASASSKDAAQKESNRGKAGSKTEKARAVGRAVARRAKEAGVRNVVFDKGGCSYHGRVRALAEGAREEGLEF